MRARACPNRTHLPSRKCLAQALIKKGLARGGLRELREDARGLRELLTCGFAQLAQTNFDMTKKRAWGGKCGSTSPCAR